MHETLIIFPWLKWNPNQGLRFNFIWSINYLKEEACIVLQGIIVSKYFGLYICGFVVWYGGKYSNLWFWEWENKDAVNFFINSQIKPI